MIDLHYWPTPNGWKISIMLEECGLPYTLVPVNIGRGEQFKPEFLAISPNNRMPAIVDHDPVGGGEPLSVFESGAILIYLAEKAQRFIGHDLRSRHATLQWLMWQMGGLGPMAGQPRDPLPKPGLGDNTVTSHETLAPGDRLWKKFGSVGAVFQGSAGAQKFRCGWGAPTEADAIDDSHTVLSADNSSLIGVNASF